MKRVHLIAGVASLAAMTAVLWGMPAAAHHWDCQGGACTHDSQDNEQDGDDDHFDGVRSIPEPGTLALFGLGLGGLGLMALNRRRVKA